MRHPGADADGLRGATTTDLGELTEYLHACDLLDLKVRSLTNAWVQDGGDHGRAVMTWFLEWEDTCPPTMKSGPDGELIEVDLPSADLEGR